MLKVAIAGQEIITEVRGAVSEEDEIVVIKEMVK
jgi:hypothetical protein